MSCGRGSLSKYAISGPSNSSFSCLLVLRFFFYFKQFSIIKLVKLVSKLSSYSYSKFISLIVSIPAAQNRICICIYNEKPLLPVYFSTILYLFLLKNGCEKKTVEVKKSSQSFWLRICYAASVEINSSEVNHWLHSEGTFTCCFGTWRETIYSAASCSSMVVRHGLGRVTCQTSASSSVATLFSCAYLNLQFFILNLCLGNACIGSEKQFLSLPVLNLQWTFNWIIQPRCQWVLIFCN